MKTNFVTNAATIIDPKRRQRAITLACLETLEHRQLLSFSPAADYASGLLPLSIAVADFNADTKPDIALVNQGSSSVSILLGNGNGTFGPSANFATGAGPRSLAVGDFNGDGKPDIATANDSGTSILLNNGAGAFASPANTTVAEMSSSVAVRDMNADGKLDLVVTTASLHPSTWS